MEWISVGKTSDLEGRLLKTVMVGEKPIIISKIGERFYAVDSICTHAQGYLPLGKVENECITCPTHHAQFDLKNGKVVKNVRGLVKVAIGGATDLTSYELKVEDGEIKIRF